MVFGRSRGVRGHGTDHAKRYPRTLAGFGLTWHGGSRFMFFGNIGNSLYHQIPQNWSSGLQVGPRIFVESQCTISGTIKQINFPQKWSPENIICGGHFLKKQKCFIFLRWCPTKPEDQPGGPRTNLEVFGDEVTFQNFQKKHENRLPTCHVRTNPAKVWENRLVWSTPCPRTHLDLPNTI